jgi:hypothetical protein
MTLTVRTMQNDMKHLLMVAARAMPAVSERISGGKTGGSSDSHVSSPCDNAIGLLAKVALPVG